LLYTYLASAHANSDLCDTKHTTCSIRRHTSAYVSIRQHTWAHPSSPLLLRWRMPTNADVCRRMLQASAHANSDLCDTKHTTLTSIWTWICRFRLSKSPRASACISVCYECMYVYTHMYVCVYIRIYMYIYTHTHTHTHTHIHIHTYIHIYIHTCIHTYMYIYIYTCMHT
jgi:hypothetical protein